MAVRLFVGNMPYGATEADLRSHFATVGDPSQVVIPVDRDTGRPRGFAFVEYLERPAAEAAVQAFNQQPFMEAWNSPAFVNLRAAHLRKDVRGTVCENCIAY